MNQKGFIKELKGSQACSTPLLCSEKLTGNYSIDLHGCWWETTGKRDNKNIWVIGEYPKKGGEAL